MDLTKEQQDFKDRYIRERGYWAEFNDGLLKYSPNWLERYLNYSKTPAEKGPLSPRIRELVYIAVDASCTHMFTPGLRIHVDLAFKCGCSARELIEVIQIATLEGITSVSTGIRILSEEYTSENNSQINESASTRLAEAYQELYGEQPGWVGVISQLSPDYSDALADLLLLSVRESCLSGKDRALIKLALASSPTNLHEESIRISVREALKEDATREEIAQIFQLVAHLGLHACMEAIPEIVSAQERGSA